MNGAATKSRIARCDWTRSKKARARAFGFLALRIGMQMALSRGANGFRFGVGGVDEPARATDVFYGLALFWPSTSRALVARCSFSPVKDSGMRFAESSSAPLLSLYMRPQKLGPRRHFDARTFGGGVKFLLFRSIYFDVSDWQF